MTRLLHISSSPRGVASESLQIAATFLDAYREAHPGHEVETWDLWDGTLPEFGPAAAAAKMTVFGGCEPEGEQAAAWRAAQEAFRRFDAADRLLFSVPMWNAGVPYILKQFVDVVSQPGLVFGIDPHAGYEGLLAGRGKQATVIYTSAVWAPHLGPAFGRDFQSTYFDDWLRWTGIDDIAEIRFHPTLTGDADADAVRREAHAAARRAAARSVAGPVVVLSLEASGELVQRGIERDRRGPAPGARAVGGDRAGPDGVLVPDRRDPQRSGHRLEVVPLRCSLHCRVDGGAATVDRAPLDVIGGSDPAGRHIGDERREVVDVYPGERRAGNRAAVGLIVADALRTQRVPHRRLARAEDRRRADEHASHPVDLGQGRVGVTLGDAVVARVIADQVAVLRHVPHARLAGIDGGGRDVHQRRELLRRAPPPRTSGSRPPRPAPGSAGRCPSDGPW